MRAVVNLSLLGFRLAWASPWTLLGLTAGALGLLTGGGARRRGRTIEFWGGAVTAALNRIPIVGGASAMTLGHVVLGSNPPALDFAREHEWIHVRQYERWGPLFIPAYLLCSVVLWFRGLDAYRDNPFEREAYEQAP